MVKRVENSERPAGLTKAGVGCLSLIALPFAGVGVAMLIHAYRLGERGHKDALPATLFGAFALLIGALLLLGIRWLYGASRRTAKLAAEHPGKPWMWNAQWAGGTIVDSSKSAAIAFWIFAIFWNAISTPVAVIVLPKELSKGNYGALFVLLFPLVGLAMLSGAAYMTLRYLKFGRSSFVMETIPGRLGGWLAGTIETATMIMGDEGVRVSLRCVNRITTGSGKHRHTTERTLWEDEQLLTGRLPATRLGGSAIPVSFAIPADCEPTRDSGNNDIVWRLKARAAMIGTDFAADFTVPVFRVESASSLPPKVEAIAAKHRSAEFAAQRSAGSLEVTSDAAGRKRFEFSARRRRASAITVSVFLLVFSTITFVIFAVGAPKIFAALFGAISLLLVYAVLRLWLLNVEVRVDRHGLERSWRMLTFSGTRRIEAAEVSAVRYRITAEVNGEAHYSVYLETRGGANMKLTSGLLQRDAKEFAGQVGEALGAEVSMEKR